LKAAKEKAASCERDYLPYRAWLLTLPAAH